MRIIQMTQVNGRPVLESAEHQTPTASPRNVLIRVVAAGVNRADVLQRDGNYPPPPGAPDWPGLEVSGVIEAVGDQVDTFRVGDEVCALLPGGGYAEYVSIDSSCVLPVPAGVDLITAAGLPEAACTVWSNLVMAAALRTGERLLVHGGSSGIGSLAIQVGRALGATVAATAGSATKLEHCRELGAQIAINHRDEDFVAAVAPGVDVVLDIIGAAYLQRNIQALLPDGRLVIIGMMGGTRAELNLGALLARRGSIITTSLRSRPLADKAEIVREVHHHLWPMIDDGRVRTIVDRTFPLDQAGQALEYMESSAHLGKIILTL